MKKITAFLFCVLLVVMLSACLHNPKNCSNDWLRPTCANNVSFGLYLQEIANSEANNP